MVGTRLTLGGLFAALAIAGRMPDFRRGRKPQRAVMPHEGRREVARRRRQIDRGLLHYWVPHEGGWRIRRSVIVRDTLRVCLPS